MYACEHAGRQSDGGHGKRDADAGEIAEQLFAGGYRPRPDREVDTRRARPIIDRVTRSIEQVVERYRRTSAKFQHDMRDPAKARAFLLRAGLVEKSKSSPSGVRLVKPLRRR